jgi:RNA-directed DNA polymerase
LSRECSGFSITCRVCLDYVFDLWIKTWREKAATGDVIVVPYADDLVMGFENRIEAQRFLKAFQNRPVKFGLELHPEKTRLIEFGRFVAVDSNSTPRSASFTL